MSFDPGAVLGLIGVLVTVGLTFYTNRQLARAKRQEEEAARQRTDAARQQVEQEERRAVEAGAYERAEKITGGVLGRLEADIARLQRQTDEREDARADAETRYRAEIKELIARARRAEEGARQADARAERAEALVRELEGRFQKLERNYPKET